MLLSFILFLNVYNQDIHPVAILSSKEDYSVLQTAGKVFQEINELINKGTTNINGQDLTLQFYLGDYNVNNIKTS